MFDPENTRYGFGFVNRGNVMGCVVCFRIDLVVFAFASEKKSPGLSRARLTASADSSVRVTYCIPYFIFHVVCNSFSLHKLLRCYFGEINTFISLFSNL